MNIKKFLLKNWPVVVYFGLTILLFLINYKPGTYLSGWDNLHPEFNFALNFSRSLSSIWQNHSLGVVMAHTPDFVHQGILFLLSLILPNSMLRYIWMMILLFTGTWGTYSLVLYAQKKGATKSHLEEVTGHQGDTPHWLWNLEHVTLLSPFISGLFYMLNLAAIQTFYAPFEAYVAHFAFLPWLILASIKFLSSKSLKNLFFLTLILLLNTTSVYIPTLFIVTSIALGVLSLVFLFQKFTVKKLGSVLVYGMIVFLTNAFWILPFLFYTLTHAGITLDSKINQMATDIIFSQNKEFGTLSSVMTLKGFWFNNVDLTSDNSFSYMMGAWRAWGNNPFIELLMIFLFIVILMGVISQFKNVRKNVLIGTFFILFLFSITSLAIVTPPFSWLNDLLRNNVKLFYEAFRFPYTKFAILASLSYTFFFSYGIASLHKLLKEFMVFSKKIQSLDHPVAGISEIREVAHESSHIHTHLSPQIPFFTGIALIVVILAISLPAFTGNFFYEKNKVTIPSEYHELFTYLDHQDASLRIANLPQYTFWGWNFYRWGYAGSGFLWYGIKQPILDRAYDVWSKTGETYYFELSNAIYKKDSALMNSVLQKYQVSYLLVDKNVINPSSAKSLFTGEIETLIGENHNIHLEKQFGNINLYRVSLTDKPHDFVFLKKSLPTVNSYTTTDNDTAYSKIGTYISQDKNPTYFYPFRELVTKKSQSDTHLAVSEDKSYVTFSSTIAPHTPPKTLHIPSYLKEKFIPATIFTEKQDDGSMVLNVAVTPPQITVNGKIIYGKSLILPLYVLPKESPYPLTLDINSVKKYTLQNRATVLDSTFFSITQDNLFTLTNGDGTLSVPQTISSVTLQSLFLLDSTTVSLESSTTPQTLEIKIPKITDNYLSFSMTADQVTASSCDKFREGKTGLNIDEQHNGALHTLFSQNGTSCSVFSSQNLPHEIGYIAFVNTQNIVGKPFHFWVLNEDEQISPIATFLPTSKQPTRSTFIIPPMEQFGKAYSFHFENISIGNEDVQNAFSGASVYAIPYKFLTELVVDDAKPTSSESNGRVAVSSPTASYYTLSLDKKDATYAVLSQSYEPYWKAYIVNDSCKKSTIPCLLPFLFGTEIKNHVLINNWENGWNLSSVSGKNTTVLLVYTPIYLEYIGMEISSIFILIVIVWYAINSYEKASL